MENESTLAAANRFIDLPAEAQPLQVERAVRRKQALYADGALATYGLLEEEARQELLGSLAAVSRKTPVAGRDAKGPPDVGHDEAPAADLAVAPGRFLRTRREAAGLSLREVADRTKISPMKLVQIEEERYAELPAPVYLRGFVVAYARLLGLADSAALTASFLERQQEALADT